MTRRLRVLFDLAYPGYLRYFDSVLKDLAARGHHVEVWFEQSNKQPEALEALDGTDIVVGGQTPRGTGWRRDVAWFVRVIADYVRYLDPAFHDAAPLRRRAAHGLPFLARPLVLLNTLPESVVRRLLRGLRTLERALPLTGVYDEFVRERRPDVVVASPYVLFTGRQADLERSARAHGIPTVAAIASWDNLTTKGMLHGSPDRVIVWNEAQAEEAVQLHFVPRSRIAVTGAQPFDKWFGRAPRRTAAEYAERVGLPPGTPYVLFVGSTRSISEPYAEQDFVRRWLDALRTNENAALRGVGVVVRPHPFNSVHWDDADLSGFGAAVVWPRAGANPVNESDRDDYFDSIFHSSAVVGVNTSAMVEAAILARPVLTIATPEFSDTQTGTLHFRYLLPENGGFVRTARSLEEHLDQLAQALAAGRSEASTAFVASFVRPQGLDRESTPLVVEAIETAALLEPERPLQASVWARALVPAVVLANFVDACISPVRIGKRLRHRAKRDARRFDALSSRLERPQTARLVARVGRRWERLLQRLAARLEKRKEPRVVTAPRARSQ